jgi:hypothetical protein
MTYRYDSLYLYLKGHSASSITLSFSCVERIIGRPLPPESATHAEWWTNESSKYPYNMQCLAWLQSGLRAFPDFISQTVRFDRGERAEAETIHNGI